MAADRTRAQHTHVPLEPVGRAAAVPLGAVAYPQLAWGQNSYELVAEMLFRVGVPGYQCADA